MVIDCDVCAMQHTEACDDCLVTAILGDANTCGILELSEHESEAVDHLADSGLVPRLRLLPRRPDGGSGVTSAAG